MKLAPLFFSDLGALAILEDNGVTDSPIFAVKIAVTENLTEHFFAADEERLLYSM